MYICPTCNREFIEEDKLTKHFLSCWKQKNPNHKPKPAPRSEDIVTRKADADVFSFFNAFQEV